MEIKTIRTKLSDEELSLREKLKLLVQNSDATQKFIQDNEIPQEVVDKNISTLTDYLFALEQVEECKEKGECVHGLYHNVRLTYINGEIIRSTEICPVAYQKTSLSIKFIANDIPQGYDNYSFRNLPKINPIILKVIFDVYDKTNNKLFISGEKEKALIASIALINELAQDYTVGVLDINKFVSECGNYFDNQSTVSYQLEKLNNVDALLIYNLGYETVNRTTIENIIYPLVVNRYNGNKITITLSDLNLNLLLKLYSKDEIRATQIVNALKQGVITEL